MAIRSRLVRHLALGGVMLALPAASMAPVPVYREFSDWVAACDNIRACSAKSLVEKGTVADPDKVTDDVLTVSREAAPDGLLTVTITSPVGAGRSTLSPDVVAIDGQPVDPPLRWTISPADQVAIAQVSGAAALPLVRRLAQANAVTLSRAGAADLPISLHGVAAALLLFDDVQGRLDTITALVRAGPGAASLVPPAPALPELRAGPVPQKLGHADALAAAVRRGQQKILGAQDCDPKREDSSPDDAAALTAQDAIVLLKCSSGAYQTWYLAFRVPRDSPQKAELLHFPPGPGLPMPERADVDSILMEPSYDAAHLVLSMSSKGRGLADCGEAQSWVFDGHAFHTSALAYQERCGGQAGEWPTLFRSRVVPAAR